MVQRALFVLTVLLLAQPVLCEREARGKDGKGGSKDVKGKDVKGKDVKGKDAHHGKGGKEGHPGKDAKGGAQEKLCLPPKPAPTAKSREEAAAKAREADAKKKEAAAKKTREAPAKKTREEMEQARADMIKKKEEHHQAMVEKSRVHCAGDGATSACCLCKANKESAECKEAYDKEVAAKKAAIKAKEEQAKQRWEAYCNGDGNGSARCVCREDPKGAACATAMKAEKAKAMAAAVEKAKKELERCAMAQKRLDGLEAGNAGRKRLEDYINGPCKKLRRDAAIRAACDKNSANYNEADCEQKKNAVAKEMRSKCAQRHNEWQKKSTEDRSKQIKDLCKKNREGNNFPAGLREDTVTVETAEEGKVRGRFTGKFTKEPSANEPWVKNLGCIMAGYDTTSEQERSDCEETHDISIKAARRLKAKRRLEEANTKTYTLMVEMKGENQMLSDAGGSQGNAQDGQGNQGPSGAVALGTAAALLVALAA
jgi:hypothetical protein